MHQAFKDLDKLAGIKLPHDLHITGNEIFKNCINLTNIVFPDSLYELSSYSFNNTPKLKNVSIPASLTNITNNSFQECGLETVVLNENITNVSTYTFYNSANLKTILIKSKVINFQNFAFGKCTNLKSFVYYGMKEEDYTNCKFINRVFAEVPKQINLYLPNIGKEYESSFTNSSFYKSSGWSNVKYRDEFDINEILRY